MDESLSPPGEREGAAQPRKGEGLSAGDSFDHTPSPSYSPSASGPLPLPQGGEGNKATLREIALDAIERTRWVPERSRNRIRAMVEGRPDWVISRQRAWGVPIALYVNRKTGEYLKDVAVNSRIIRAFHEG